MADFPRLERKSDIFELLLHLPWPKESPMQLDQPFFLYISFIILGGGQVSLLPGAAAVRLGHRKITEGNLVRPNATLMTLNDPDRFLFRPRDLRLSPAARPSAILMLDQEMGSSYLAVLCAFIELPRSRCAVMLRHVCF